MLIDPSDGPVTVEVSYTNRVPIEEVDIRPRGRGLKATIDGASFSFTLDHPDKLSLEVPGHPQLFFWANPPETDQPDPDDLNVTWSKGGQVYEADEFRIGENQTLYIEGGAAIRGMLRVRNADNVTLRGHGILDGRYYLHGGRDFRHLARFDTCKNVPARDVTMIQPSGWMLVPCNCEDVHIFKQIRVMDVKTSKIYWWKTAPF